MSGGRRLTGIQGIQSLPPRVAAPAAAAAAAVVATAANSAAAAAATTIAAAVAATVAAAAAATAAAAAGGKALCVPPLHNKEHQLTNLQEGHKNICAKALKQI